MSATCLPDEIREYRGTLTGAGKEQPLPGTAAWRKIWRLFEEMKNGVI